MMYFILSIKYFGVSYERDVFLYSIMIVTFAAQLIFGHVFENIRYNFLDPKIKIIFKEQSIIGRTISTIFLANILFAFLLYVYSIIFPVSDLVYFAVLYNLPVFFLSSVSSITTNIIYSFSNKAILISNIISSIIPSLLTFLLSSRNVVSTFTIINYSFLVSVLVVNFYFLNYNDLLKILAPRNPFKKYWYTIYKQSSYLYLNFFIAQFYKYFEMLFLLSFNNGSLSLFDYIRRIMDFIKNLSGVIINAYVVKFVTNKNYEIKSIHGVIKVSSLICISIILFGFLLTEYTSIISLFNIQTLEMIFKSNYNYLVFGFILAELINYLFVTVYFTIKKFRDVSIISSLQMIFSILIMYGLKSYFGYLSLFIALITSLLGAILAYYFLLKNTTHINAVLSSKNDNK